MSATLGIDELNHVKDKVMDLVNDWEKNHKRANILIVGKTGVGKSTLINAVFRGDLAKTGTGKPITQKIEEIRKPDFPLTIIDTKGLELAEYASIKDDLIAEVRNRQGDDENSYVHLAWLCLSEEGSRIEPAEIELAKALTESEVKVIIVITKASKFKNNEFEAEVRKEFSGISSDVCLTRGISEKIYDDDDELIAERSVKGIDELISQSYLYIPENQRRSFAKALSLRNKKSLSVKKEQAENFVLVASTTAAAAAAVPLPFSDALTLVPIQISMIWKISEIFGMEFDKGAALPVVSTILGSSAATAAGRMLVSSALKLIPGIGSVAGAAISGVVARQLTQTMGDLYISVLVEMIQAGMELDLSSAIRLFQEKINIS